MWPDGWTALDRVGTLPSRLHASVGRHPMTDRTKDKWSISRGSPLLGCRARLGLQMILDGFGLNGDCMLVALFYATVLTGGRGPSS